MTLGGNYNGTPTAGNACTPCPAGYTCAGDKADKAIEKEIAECDPGQFPTDANGNYDPYGTCTDCPEGSTCSGGAANACKQGCECQTDGTQTSCKGDISDLDKYGHNCGDYAGSLYQRLVRYAIQSCIRPSYANDPEYTISADVLADVNAVMDSIRVDMGVALANECERLGGTWVDTMWVDNDSDDKHDYTGDTTYKKFYDETGANTQWGYCKPSTTTVNDTTPTTE